MLLWDWDMAWGEGLHTNLQSVVFSYWLALLCQIDNNIVEKKVGWIDDIEAN